MWYEERPGREDPWLARWREAGGKKKSAAFGSAEERAKFAGAWVKRRQQVGRAAQFVDVERLEVWRRFSEITGGADPLRVAREWAERCAAGGVDDITVKAAIDNYLAFRAEGKLSADTWRHFEKHLRERFAGEFGERQLREVTDTMIRGWLAALKNPRTGEPVESVTRRHHRKDLNTFFEYACRVKRWVDRNPCEAVAVPPIVEKDVRLLTVDEGRRLFAANEGNPAVGRMALEAFGFLRASSAGRIRREDIAFDVRGLRLRGAEHKSEKTRFRQGQPDNLWAWLARAPDETWAMPWWKYRNEKTLAFRAAGIDDGSQNRLKKTCISAHLAWLKNPALTARLSQHRYASTTEIYEGVMTEADGAAWFAIGPAFVV